MFSRVILVTQRYKSRSLIGVLSKLSRSLVAPGTKCLISRMCLGVNTAQRKREVPSGTVPERPTFLVGFAFGFPLGKIKWLFPLEE